jgi:hypothetical protein
MTTHAFVDTAEMPAWTGEEAPPQAFYTWESFTELGPFQPNWTRNRRAPYAHRVEHTATHTVHAPGLRKGRLGKWMRSVGREVAHRIANAFVQIGEFA